MSGNNGKRTYHDCDNISHPKHKGKIWRQPESPEEKKARCPKCNKKLFTGRGRGVNNREKCPAGFGH